MSVLDNFGGGSWDSLFLWILPWGMPYLQSFDFIGRWLIQCERLKLSHRKRVRRHYLIPLSLPATDIKVLTCFKFSIEEAVLTGTNVICRRPFFTLVRTDVFL